MKRLFMLRYILPFLVGTKSMAVDMITKTLGAVAFYLFCGYVLNLNNAPNATVVLRGYSARLWRWLVGTTRSSQQR